MTESKALTTTEEVTAMIPRLAEVRDVIAGALAGGTVTEFQLDRVHVPGAGGTTWTIPTLEGDIETKTIEGVIVGYKMTRGYWPKPYSAGDPTPPDCASNDGVTGTGDRGPHGSGPQDCRTCPLAQWGTKLREGKQTRSQACKAMMPVFLLTPRSMLPVVITVPPSSLKSVTPYPLRLAGQGINWWGCISQFTLEKETVGGYPTAVVKTKFVSRLSAEQTEALRQYKEALAPLVRQAVVDVEGGVVEDELFE